MLITAVRSFLGLEGGVVAAATGSVFGGAGGHETGAGARRASPGSASAEAVAAVRDRRDRHRRRHYRRRRGVHGHRLLRRAGGGGAERHRPVPRSHAARQGSVRPRADSCSTSTSPATRVRSPGSIWRCTTCSRQGARCPGVQSDRWQRAPAGAGRDGGGRRDSRRHGAPVRRMGGAGSCTRVQGQGGRHSGRRSWSGWRRFSAAVGPEIMLRADAKHRATRRNQRRSGCAACASAATWGWNCWSSRFPSGTSPAWRRCGPRWTC